MSKRKLRLGVVGLGMGRGHANDFQQQTETCDLVALADLDEARLSAAGKELGVKDLYTDANEMFAKAGLDAVSIAVPNKFHHPLTVAALDAGLHVLCEKPMAMTVAEAEEMKAAADQAGLKLMINFSFRFSDSSFALKQQVDAGVLGKVYFGRTVWHRRRGMPGFGGWFGQKALSGGGPLIDLGVHRIDLALWLMGHPEPISVSGSTYNIIAAKKAAAEKKAFDVEDLACGLVKFDNGATLIVEASWALNVRETDQISLALYGEQGGLVQWHGANWEHKAEIYVEEGGNLFTKSLDAACVPAPSAYREFVNCILEDREPLATAEQGIKVQKILEGLYRSAAEGREICF